MSTESSSPRYSIRESLKGIKASIPPRRNWRPLLLLCVWLAGWAMGEVAAISVIFHIDIGYGNDPMPGKGIGGWIFIPCWLAMWTVGGSFILIAVVWQFLGREIIGVEAGELIYRVEVLGIGWTQVFAGNQITRMRPVGRGFRTLSREARRWHMPTLFMEGIGSVAFDYDARAYRIGVSLDKPEARLLIQQMKPWLPEGAVAG